MVLSEQTGDLFAALAKFRGECPPIKKDAEVKVKNNAGKFLYSFKYATLGNIITTITPKLSENGLVVSQEVTNNGVRTMIAHKSGQWMLTGYLPITIHTDQANDQKNEQSTGSSITYKKRYQLTAVLDLDTETDDDANVASGNVPEFKADLGGPPESEDKPKKKAKTKPKKEAETHDEPEEDEEPPFDVDTDEDGVAEFLANAKSAMDVVKWWKQMLDENPEAREKYQSKVMARMDELD